MQYYEHVCVGYGLFLPKSVKKYFRVLFSQCIHSYTDRLRTRNVITPSEQFEVFSRTHIKAERRF